MYRKHFLFSTALSTFTSASQTVKCLQITQQDTVQNADFDLGSLG